MKSKHPDLNDVKELIRQLIIDIDDNDKQNKTRIHPDTLLWNLRRHRTYYNNLETQLQYLLEKGYDIVIELKENELNKKGFCIAKKSKRKIILNKDILDQM